MITAFTWFDIRTFATTQARRTLIPLLFIAAFSISVPIPGFSIVVAAAVATVSVSYPFLSDERGLLDTLYATTPVSRSAVVIGRYITLLAFATVAVAIGLLTSVVAAVVRQQHVDGPLMASSLLVAFGVVAVGVAAQLPWFFALGYTRARPVLYVPVVILGAAGWFAAQSGLLNGATSIDLDATPSPELIVGVCAIGLALLALSVVVSARLYRRREL